MSVSIDTKWVFSVLNQVKTKLRNNIGDDWMSNLVMMNSYPGIVQNMFNLAA